MTQKFNVDDKKFVITLPYPVIMIKFLKLGLVFTFCMFTAWCFGVDFEQRNVWLGFSMLCSAFITLVAANIHNEYEV